jgi:hypothetical protein
LAIRGDWRHLGAPRSTAGLTRVDLGHFEPAGGIEPTKIADPGQGRRLRPRGSGALAEMTGNAGPATAVIVATLANLLAGSGEPRNAAGLAGQRGPESTTPGTCGLGRIGTTTPRTCGDCGGLEPQLPGLARTALLDPLTPLWPCIRVSQERGWGSVSRETDCALTRAAGEARVAMAPGANGVGA